MAKSNDLEVGQQTRRGISWNLAGAVLTNGMRIAVIAILGRALDSTDFGIVAAAVSVNVILYSIRDIGVGQALVQRKNLDPGHISTAFAVSVYLGLLLAGLLIIGAPTIGRLYGISASVDVLRVLGLLYLVRGVSATSRVMCQREMKFRAVAIIDAASFAAGSVFSMVLAVLGAGPWALVGGYVVEEILSSALYLKAYRPPITLRVDRARLRDLMKFGTGQTVSQIAGILATYGDNFVVGRMLGAEALGFYTRAYDLIKFPSTVFAAVVGNVLFPAFSKIQDDRARLALSFRRVLFVNALVLLPASATLFVLAPEVIEILMGSGWGGAVLPFRILTVTILLRTTQKLGAIVATAAGRVNAIAIAYLVYMGLVIGGAALAIPWGIGGVAVTTAIAIAVVSVECCYLAMRASQLSLLQVLGAHAPGLVLALAVAGITYPLAELLRGRDVSVVLVFGIVSVTAVGLALGAIVFGLVRRSGDFAWLGDELRRMRKRSPKRSG